MKRTLLPILMTFVLLPLVTACGKYDYSAHISDERSDLFCAETEEFSLTVACVEREYPFLCDGKCAPRSKTVEATLTEKTKTGAEYEFYFLEDEPKGGEMSFRSVSGDYYYSRGTETFPTGSLSLRVVKDGTPCDLIATSVKTPSTLSPSDALSRAETAERDYFKALIRDGVFRAELHVRLLRRDKNYYYVGVVDEEGKTLSLLLDAETGNVLASRRP